MPRHAHGSHPTCRELGYAAQSDIRRPGELRRELHPFFGLFWLVIVVTLGVRTVEGAVQAGLALALFPELLNTLGISPQYQFILFGLGALTFARHPEGLLEFAKHSQLDAIRG